MAPPLCYGVDQTYPIIRLAYIRLRQSVALVPLSHRATTVQRPIGWPGSEFWTCCSCFELSKFWTTPRGRYRVTKCCPAGAQMFLRPLHTRIDVRFLHIPASAVAQTASNACGYPNAADGATPIPHIPPGCFLWLRSPMSLSMRAWMLAFINISVLGFRFFQVFAPVRQAPYIADNFGNTASCPDGGQLPALSAAPGWPCGGVILFWGPFPLRVVRVG